MSKNGIEVDHAMLHSCVDAYKTKLKNLKNNVKTRRISKKHNSLSKLFTILQNKYQNLLAYDLDEHLSQFSNNLTVSHQNLLAKKDQSITGANLLVDSARFLPQALATMTAVTKMGYSVASAGLRASTR
jgi:hypothetical protein